MDPSVWRRVQRHFDAVCDLAPAERSAALARLEPDQQIRAQVEQLLAFDGAADLDEVAGKVGQLARRLDGSERLGETVGAYRLVRMLGEGGMGEVYLAERADGRFDARVAVKFLAVGGRRGQRLFDRERRILARLDHPDIARMLDAGEHHRFGAYLVMEFVDGVPLNRYVQTRTAGPAQVIHWVCRAARAVAFAHQNLILHRDLKPEHLMVTADGRLKVLDFGVATLIDPQVVTGEQTVRPSFTPRYAAPEQLLDQPSTTRTDVYALGLILFELLCQGRGPFGSEPGQLAERKLAGRVDRLGPIAGLRPRQQRDLAAIIDKALARQPGQRYAGPEELAADLTAVNDDRPIALRSPSWPELGWRWWMRHRLAGAALLIAVLALVGGTGFSSWFAYQAQRDRDAAVMEAGKARAIAGFLERIFETSSPGIESGPDLRARDLLEQGRARIDRELADEPVIAASLELSMARSFLNLGLYQDALSLLEPRRANLPATLDAQRQLLAARLDALSGQYQRSLERLSALELEGVPANLTAEAAVLRATAYINLGQPEQVGAAVAEALAAADESDPGLEIKLSANTLLGAVAYGRGDYRAAQAIYADIHRLSVLRYGEINDQTGMALNNLAGIALMSGDLETAVSHYQRAVETYEQFFGVDNRAMALALRGLGMSYRRLGRAADAERLLRRAAAAFEHWNGRENLLFQETVVQRLELLILLDRQDEMLNLLLALPPADVPEGLDSRGVVCRLSRLRQVYNHQPAPPQDCMATLSVPDYVTAFDLFLRTVEAGRLEPSALDTARARALGAMAELVPPDPLLLEALERL